MNETELFLINPLLEKGDLIEWGGSGVCLTRKQLQTLNQNLNKNASREIQAIMIDLESGDIAIAFKGEEQDGKW